ncbi:radical SAM/SPASM domain-containing protein [Gloeobacter violaceus]|uniref:Glr2245 protein n=1 Tax=Gloeobacter violaceus (strain ATCC 29082 / PCC 7421) TaxID=251221 RepID=Q7NID8_GLOVI|nr:radical SAM protein [Gloeobacter violaceus]BAC90186.1 glr2245 [Gloeobacter violaceus PCC 7421]
MQPSPFNVSIRRGDKHYIFNTFSGKLLQISHKDSEALDQYCNGIEAQISPELLLKLVVYRMLVADGEEEYALLQKRYQSSQQNPRHYAATIVTSLGCNFDCPYCYEAKSPSILTKETQIAFLQLLDEKLPTLNSFSVTWFGGEPLLGKNALLALSDQFIHRCESANVDYSATLITNGYLLDEKTCLQLRERNVYRAQVGLDGPPEIHNRMRPLASGSGSGTFDRIIENLRHAVEYLKISIRVNIDRHNFARAEDLLKILEANGLSGKLMVYLGRLVSIDDGIPTPSAAYHSCCLTNQEFAQIESAFMDTARRYKFAESWLPKSVGTPCTAVRTNEIVLGSKGELYKCWDSVGNPLEVIGHISDYNNCNTRLQKWLKYNPFTDAECRSCFALPVCMGGCAHYAMNPSHYDNRCDTFRYNHRERILAYIEAQEQKAASG